MRNPKMTDKQLMQALKTLDQVPNRRDAASYNPFPDGVYEIGHTGQLWATDGYAVYMFDVDFDKMNVSRLTPEGYDPCAVSLVELDPDKEIVWMRQTEATKKINPQDALEKLKGAMRYVGDPGRMVDGVNAKRLTQALKPFANLKANPRLTVVDKGIKLESVSENYALCAILMGVRG